MPDLDYSITCNCEFCVEQAVDYVVEQLDYLADSLIEARNYAHNAFQAYDSLPVALVTPFDAARIADATNRAREELDLLANTED